MRGGLLVPPVALLLLGDVLPQHKQAFACCRIPPLPPSPAEGATEGFRMKSEPVMKSVDCSHKKPEAWPGFIATPPPREVLFPDTISLTVHPKLRDFLSQYQPPLSVVTLGGLFSNEFVCFGFVLTPSYCKESHNYYTPWQRT